jgi:hypothetical protein
MFLTVLTWLTLWKTRKMSYLRSPLAVHTPESRIGQIIPREPITGVLAWHRPPAQA